MNVGAILFPVLEAGGSKIKGLASSGPGEDSFPGWQMAAFLLCPHMASPECELSSCLFLFFNDTGSF